MTLITEQDIPSRMKMQAAGLSRNEGSRPMLARDADAMYWMSRYVERAEHIARLLLVNANLLIDVGDMEESLEERQWQSVLSIMHLDELPPSEDNKPIAARVPGYMTFNVENPNSIYNCLSRARENARGNRENISSEMWENINTLYWSIRGDEAVAKFEDSPDDFYRSMMSGSMLFQGLTDQTMPHDQRWLFTQVAKYFERIDVTCRVIETKFNILRAAENSLESPIRNIQWMAVLRSCCSIEAYRRGHVGDMDPARVAEFLILDRDFPRTIRYSVNAAHKAISQIRAGINPGGIDAAERIIGRLDAQLEYAQLEDVLLDSLPNYLQHIQQSIIEAALAVQKAYFLH